MSIRKIESRQRLNGEFNKTMGEKMAKYIAGEAGAIALAAAAGAAALKLAYNDDKHNKAVKKHLADNNVSYTEHDTIPVLKPGHSYIQLK